MAAPPEALMELDALLQSLQGLKPPGVNKTKVETITKICTSMQNTLVGLNCPLTIRQKVNAHRNVQSQAQIVDIIVQNFNRAPSTHKLGLIYIVDTVTRHWKAAGFTWAAGVNRMTEALPALMNTLLQVAPDNQKEKIAKLLDIWISSRTFPDHLLTNYKTALTAPTPAAQGLPQGATSNNPIAQAASNGTNGAAPPQPNPAASAMLAQLGNVQQSGPPPQPSAALNAVSVNPPAVNIPAPAFPALVPQLPTSNQNALAASLNGGTQGPPNALVALQLLQSLGTQLSPENIQAVLQAAGIPIPPPGQPQGATVPPPPFPPASAPPAQPQFSAPEQNNQYRGGYDDRSRARSRSPDYNRRYSPPDRRDSPYRVYDPSGATNRSSQADNDRRGRGKGRGFRNDYRQRTPPAVSRDRPATPQGIMSRSNMPKPMGYDPKIPNGKIRGKSLESKRHQSLTCPVLSRTLFVGGVSAKTNETELKHFFSRFGNVQSCIVNHDKRHAFLKLISHQDAQVTKQAVDMLPSDEYRGKFERVSALSTSI